MMFPEDQKAAGLILVAALLAAACIAYGLIDAHTHFHLFPF